MPSPIRIVTARPPSRVPRPLAKAMTAERAKVQPAPITGRGVPQQAPGEHDAAALAASADRVWRIMSGQEEG